MCIDFLFLCYLFFSIHHHFESYISHLSLCWLWPPLEMTKRSKSINSKILTLQTPLLGNSIYMINVSFGALFRKDVIPNFENTYNLTILCNLHFTIIFNTTYSKPSISSNLRTLQIRSSHARLSGSYNTKHCQDNTICLLAKKKTYCVTSPMFTFPIAWAELRNASSFMDVTMMIFELIPGGNVIRCYYCRLIGTRISVGHCQQALWEAAFKCR